MTDTLQPTVPTRPAQPVVKHHRWVVLGGLAAAIGFFLPWEESWLNFGPSLGTSSGLSFAQTTDSAASGNSLAILWIALIAAGILIAGGLYAMFLQLDSRSLRWLCGLMAVLGAAGIASIWLTLPGEIDTWSGLVVEYQYGIWLTTLGLAVGAVAALVGINDPGVEPV